jgi:hypothetical protein
VTVRFCPGAFILYPGFRNEAGRFVPTEKRRDFTRCACGAYLGVQIPIGARNWQAVYMKPVIVYSLLSIVALLIFSSSALAEAVYLKNGRVMIGRIVERNQAYMVIQRGEGAKAVKATIFLDDIAKIESEEDYFRNMPITPPFLWQGLQSSSIMNSEIAQEALAGHYDNRERIKNLIEWNKKLAVEEKSKPSNKPLPESNEEAMKMFENPLAEKSFYAAEELEAQKERLVKTVAKKGSGTEAPEAGDGRISGVVRVPEDKVVPTSGGTRALYVYLLNEASIGKFFFPVPMLYSIVTPKNVALGKASYSIRNIPSGRYKVIAEWDVDDPMIQEQTSKGKKILNYLGSKGDYRGEYPKVVEVSGGSDIGDLNFDCITVTKYSISSFETQPQVMFLIKDLYYYRPSPGIYKFILVVQNPGDDPLDPITLELFVNGTKCLFPLELSSIGPHKEKQYDITEYVDNIFEVQAGDQEAPAPIGQRTLTFKISAPWDQEVLFEKTMSVF